MKKFKKIAASLMAVVAMATSMVGISASAYNYSEPYATHHTEAGVPTYSGVYANVSIIYSVKGSTCYQNSAGSNMNNGTGYLYITCTNGTMNAVTMYRWMLNKVCKPTYTGAIPCSSYNLRAYSTTSGATYSSNGNMVTNT